MNSFKRTAAMKISVMILAVLALSSTMAMALEEEAEEDDIKQPNGSTNETSSEDISASDDDLSALRSEELNDSRILKETDISILSDNCKRGICRNLVYDNPQEVVFFESKPKVRFTSDNTYVIKEPKALGFDVLTFMDSKFYNFPLNLFYTIKIKELDMRNCSIAHLTWDNFLMADHLSILLLSGNHLSEIKPMTFNNAENLSFLFLDSNGLHTLHRESFRDLSKLYMLDLHDNLLDALPENIFSYLPALQQLNLAGNRLTVIYDAVFNDNPRLSSVSLQDNALEALGEYVFQNQQSMVHIDLSNNQHLKSLVGNIHTDYLWARNCSLSRINIYGKARNVDLKQNQITELYFTQPESLETLILSANSLEQLASLSKATNLKYLDLSHNQHLKIDALAWEVDSLERLDLSNTSLTTVPLAIIATPERLKTLNVSANDITQIDPLYFRHFEKLHHLYLHDNNWNCYNLQLLMSNVIQPYGITYTPDRPDEEWPGEFIGGIKCMYRLEEVQSEQQDSNVETEYNMSILRARLGVPNDSGDSLDSSAQNDIDGLRREVTAVVRFYEQKFDEVFKRLENLDERLKQFERFNKTLWNQITITV